MISTKLAHAEWSLSSSSILISLAQKVKHVVKMTCEVCDNENDAMGNLIMKNETDAKLADEQENICYTSIFISSKKQKNIFC